MGHEIVGDVLDGPGAGRSVLVDPTVSCGRCDLCRRGRENLCESGWLLGRDRDGGLSERIAVPTANLYEVPAGLDPGSATLLQVLTTCVHAQSMCAVAPGEPAIVVGAGVTGLLHLQLAKAAGAHPLVCVSRSEWKLDLAASLGADTTVRATGDDAIERARDATGGGAELVIECAGTVETLAFAVGASRTGGRVLAFGTIASTEGRFPFYDLYHKELVLTSPRAARPADFPAAIEAVRSGGVRFDGFVTHRFPLAESAAAVGVAGGPDALKVVVEVS